jgi:hypothetical protein
MLIQKRQNHLEFAFYIETIYLFRLYGYSCFCIQFVYICDEKKSPIKQKKFMYAQIYSRYLIPVKK